MAGNITESNALAQFSKAIGLIGGYSEETAAGTFTLDGTYGNVAGIDAGGAGRTVLLQAEADSAGRLQVIVNRSDAAEDLTVKEDSSTTTIGTVSQNELGIFWCDGTTWDLVALVTIALS